MARSGPSARVLAMHARRVAARFGPNQWALRRMAADPAPSIRRLAHELTGTQSEAAQQAIRRIEDRRAAIAAGEVAAAHGYRADRLAALATTASKSERWGRVLAAVVRAHRPARSLELGTAVGISGAYLATAMAEIGEGRLVTIDRNPGSMAIADETFEVCGVRERVDGVVGSFDDVVPALLADEPCGLVFKDGAHDFASTVGWFGDVVAASTVPVVIVLDDIRRDAEMLRAWRSVRTSTDVEASVDFLGMGLVLVGEGSPGRHYTFGVR